MARIEPTGRVMIDIFSLLISHGLILLAAWRLTPRAELDRDSAADGPEADGNAPDA